MPIPKPSKGETEGNFISRCMGNPTMNSEYKDQKQRSAVCYSSWRDTKEEEKEEATSDAPWASVDKSALPVSAFLWVEDPKKKSTWHLPYKDASGNINLGALRAIAAAVAGARTGSPMSIPSSVRAKITALLKRHKIGQYAGPAKKTESHYYNGGEGSDFWVNK